jgi:antitoxin component YwqK of YwqJK toxin-antitoxin module
MKNTLLIFILILISGCQGADIHDAEKRNENWIYWIDSSTGKSSWIPVGDNATIENGKYTTFYTKGSIYEKGTLKDGKHFDTIYCYDINENLIKYKLVKSDTLIQYYIKDGSYIAYFQNGKIFEKGVVKNHKHGNEWTRYFKNGNIEWIEKLENKTGLTLWYYDNGQISDSIYNIKGKANGEIKIWHKNGQIKEISNWNNGIQNGIYETYYENGNPNQKANWINGIRDGKIESWYDNGKVRGEGQYKNGMQDGIWTWYYDSGKLKNKQTYVDGQLVE